MAIRVRERPDSGGISYDASGGGTTLRYTVVTTAGETEAQIYTAALFGSFAYYNGFIRNKITVEPSPGPNVWAVTIEYGTTGVGGGDQPLGGAASDGSPPPNPTGPPTSSTPLTSGWSFSIRAPRLNYKRSFQVVGSAGYDGAAPLDHKGAIGVSADKKEVEGVDWPPEPAFTFSRTVARATVDVNYLETLALLAGRPNDAAFYGFDPECVLLLEASGQYTEGEGWSINFTFGVELAEAVVEIVPGLLPKAPDTLSKQGWHYLDVHYEQAVDGAKVTLRPVAAYVHRIVRAVDFGLLEIGA